MSITEVASFLGISNLLWFLVRSQYAFSAYSLKRHQQEPVELASYSETAESKCHSRLFVRRKQEKAITSCRRELENIGDQRQSDMPA